MTDTTTLAALESRLAKLEGRNRLLTTCLAAALVIGVFTAARIPSQPRSFSEVRAHRFMLMAEKGSETNGTEISRRFVERPVAEQDRSVLPPQALSREKSAIIRASSKEGGHSCPPIDGLISVPFGSEIGVWQSNAGGFPSFEMGKRVVPRPIVLKDRPGGPSFQISNPHNSSIELKSHSSSCHQFMSARSPVGGDGKENVRLTAGNSSALHIWRPDSSRFSIAPGTQTPFRLAGPAQREIWVLRKNALNLNGLPLSLNDRLGTPIQILPQEATSSSTQTTEKPFPLFGPRRWPIRMA